MRHSSKTWGVTNNLDPSTIIVTVKAGFLCWRMRKVAVSPALCTAMRHHKEQGLEVLRNPVFYVGVPKTSDAEIHRMFLNWLVKLIYKLAFDIAQVFARRYL